MTVSTSVLRDGTDRHPAAARAETGVRADIQVLRAWAVLTVVLNHARLTALPGGFLGVDIFFVISGYLMTRIIDEGLENGSFTFSSFYARRVRRLLPAAYATLVATALAAPFLLDATEYHYFVAQLAAAYTFTANLVLWKQADYFGTQATMKPLLHIWSLSIEEQYYLVLPFALFVCPRRMRLPLGILMVVGSFAVCQVFMTRSATAAFYLLPSRAWELGIGSVVALLVRRQLVLPMRATAVRAVCGAILLVAPFLASEDGHPGLVASLVCLATAMLLVPGAALNRFAGPLRPITVIGDRSYSLYLLHWPLIAFANNIFIAPVPLGVRLALLALAAVFTELQYRLVEGPFRKLALTWRSLAMLLAVPIVSVGASFWVAQSMGSLDTRSRAGGTGLAPSCESRGLFKPAPECMSAAKPHTLLWGDSFAMAAAPGLAATSPDGIVQATRSVCGPFLGLSPINAIYGYRWGEDCAAFNASVLGYLAANADIKVVVLSSALAQYVPGAEDLNWHNLVKTSDGFKVEPQSEKQLIDALAETVAAVRQLGRRVVLLAPPPSSSFDASRCQERLAEHKPTVTTHPDCTFTTAEFHTDRRPILDFLSDIRTRDVVPILDLSTWMCATGHCKTRLNGTIVYRDGVHLSAAGSMAIAKEMEWGQLVAGMAR